MFNRKGANSYFAPFLFLCHPKIIIPQLLESRNYKTILLKK